MTRRLDIARLGVVPYGQALRLQYTLRDRLQADPEGRQTPIGYLLCLEHPETVTLGKRGKLEDLIARDWLRTRGVEVFRIERGGEATFHAPGQLVIYPIVQLDRLGVQVIDLIRGIAADMAAVLAEHFEVLTAYDTDHPGLWTQDEPLPRKIASVGMRVSRKVTTHGVAINVVNDMTGFQRIVACGMPDAQMLRLADRLPEERDLVVDQVREPFLRKLAQRLDVELVETALALPEPAEWVPPLAL